MLGLGISKSAQGVKSGIAKLLNSLKRRAEYFENKNDSKSEIKVLKDYELLDKATILLTPTATSDARVHSAKTYTGENVLTGNNSTFDSGIGDWQAYNGAAGASVAHSTDKLEVTLSSSEGGARINTSSLFTGSQAGKTLKVRARIWKGTSTHSTIAIYVGGVQKFVTISSTPTYFEVFLKPTNTGYLTIYRAGTGSTGTYFIDDVSVIDVSSDFDFDRASSATRINSDGLVQDMQSITDPELVLNGDFEELGDNNLTAPWVEGNGWSTITDGIFCDGSVDGGHTKNNVEMTDYNGKAFLLTYTLSNVTDSSTLKYKFGGGSLVSISGTEGTHSVYITNDATVDNFQFVSTAGWAGYITNISLKQVDPNDRWTLDTGWSIEDGVANFNDTIATTNAVLRQDNLTLTNGNTYELSFNVNNTSGTGEIKFQATGGGSDGLGGYQVYSGVNTLYFTPTANRTTLKIFGRDTYGSFTIDNVSLKDITFSTDVDLARINYDSNGENGHILLEPTSTNLVAYSEDFSQWSNVYAALTPNQSSPDGSNNAYIIEDDSAVAYRKVDETITTNATPHTFSVFIKKKTSSVNSYSGIQMGMGFSYIVFDSFNGTYYEHDNTNYDNVEVQDFNSNWWRLKLTATVTTSTRIALWGAISSSATNINNGATGSEIFYGAQLEELPYATSYIPNHGTAVGVTRAAETLTGSGNSTLINTTEGTLYLESKLGSLTGTKLFSIGGGTNNADPAVIMGYSSQNMYIDIQDGGSLISTPSDKTISGINTSSYNKMAIKYTTTNVTVYLNGVKKHTETIDFTPDTNVIKSLYGGYSAGSKFEGAVKALAVFNEALTDDELELLTGVTNYGSFSELASANGYTII
jgi:hypothetical protein